MLQVISLLLENKPGALMRVTGLLSQRGYNIESLTVARTLDPELSRMTIAVDVDATLRQQVIKQMNKLHQRAAGHRPDRIAARWCANWCWCASAWPQETRTAVLKEAEIFGGRVVDSSTEGFAIEVTGDPEKLNEFVDVMGSYGEIDVTRSGAAGDRAGCQETEATAARADRARGAARKRKSCEDGGNGNGKTILRKRRKS